MKHKLVYNEYISNVLNFNFSRASWRVSHPQFIIWTFQAFSGFLFKFAWWESCLHALLPEVQTWKMNFSSISFTKVSLVLFISRILLEDNTVQLVGWICRLEGFSTMYMFTDVLYIRCMLAISCWGYTNPLGHDDMVWGHDWHGHIGVGKCCRHWCQSQKFSTKRQYKNIKHKQ